MAAAHDSYTACGLGSPRTDLLVNLVREAGPASGLYGAKITGGGSGGAVAILGRSDADDAVATIARQYTQNSPNATPTSFAVHRRARMERRCERLQSSCRSRWRCK